MVTKFIFDLQLFDDTFLDILEQQDGSYLIKTAEELQGLATYVNAGNDCAGLTFKLAPENDVLDLSSITNFTPIGKYAYYSNNQPFVGTFDGNGKTISGLKITGNNDYVGLFGFIANDNSGNKGTIKNVKLTGVEISGGDYVGGVVGRNSSGTIEDCTVSGTISGGDYVGGIVGENYNGEVKDCTNSSSVSGNNHVGGVVGEGSVGENCYYYKNNNTTYTNTTDGTQIYKLTLPEGVTVESGAVTIGDETYYTKNVTLEYSGDYLKVGDSFIEKQDGKFSLNLTADAEIKTAATFLDTLDKDGTTYLIKTAGDLQRLATYVNAGNDCANLTFKLAPENDVLDLSSISNFTPIGNSSNSFKGTFDGDGKIISGLTITGNDDYIGLFGYVEGGTVKK